MAVSPTSYVAVPPSSVAMPFGPGKPGDLLLRLVAVVTAQATSQVTLQDGNGTALTVVPDNTPRGVYTVDLGVACHNPVTPGWKLTTQAGVSVIAIGRYN